MSEISMYEAQKKKMEGLCDEHGLTYRFKKDGYPIVFILKPCASMDAQMSMLENVEDEGFISPEASMTWIFADGALQTKVQGGTFTISKTLRTKIENILTKMITYWQQFFFRDVMERNALREGSMPVIDESEDDVADPMDEAEPLEEIVDDTEIPDSDFEEDAEEISEEEIDEATAIIRMENKATVSLLQRRMGVTAGDATRIMNKLEELGVVGPVNGTEPREVLPFDEPAEEE